MEICKNKSSNKIIIYQMPLFERIFAIFSMIGFLLFAILALFILSHESIQEFSEVLGLLFIALLYNFFMYFQVFKVYICLDIEKQMLIIREDPGFKQEVIPLNYVKYMEVSDDIVYKTTFELNIICKSHTRIIKSWSEHFSRRLAMFNVYKRQTERLKIFADQCNKYLNNRTAD